MADTVGVIAIDGPVAAGKTMVGRQLAQRLAFRYLDTGVMYRAITWLALRHTTSLEDYETLGKLARNNPITMVGQDSDLVMVGELRVGPELREEEIDCNVSLVSQVSAVRQALVSQQRKLAAEGKIVVVGRDIGTVVLPDADLKVFISAPLEERARRRWRELLGQGSQAEFQRILEETKARDDLDSHRADSPLIPAEDAWHVDTGGLSIDEVVALILQRVDELSGVNQG